MNYDDELTCCAVLSIVSPDTLEREVAQAMHCKKGRIPLFPTTHPRYATHLPLSPRPAALVVGQTALLSSCDGDWIG